jgi:ribosomal protein S18 acetylase RimI-like enzyme
MQDLIATLPVPEWRDARVPAFRHLESALADDGVFVFAAFDGKRPAGFVSGYRFPSLTKECDLVYIYDVYVAPADRGRGVGRKLMDRMLAECRSEGVAQAWVGADLDNPAAYRLFAGSGAKSHAEYTQFEFDFARE